MSKTALGVIGGLGPYATARFLELTAQMTDAENEQQHMDMIVYNFPSIPDQTGYLLGSNLKSPFPGLLWAARGLSRQRVRGIAIPCITAHYFYNDLNEEVRVPIINAVEETVKELSRNHIQSAGVLATDGTIVSGLFTKALLSSGIRPVLPSRESQADVMHLIYENVKAGKAAEMDRFHRCEEELRQKGAEAIILGCTELSLIKRDHPLNPGFLDAMEVLARESVLLCGKPLKKSYQNLIT